MTICLICNKHYWEHEEKDLISCNKQKDSILNLYLLKSHNKGETQKKKIWKCLVCKIEFDYEPIACYCHSPLFEIGEINE